MASLYSAYQQVQHGVVAQRDQAVATGKPTMWAYYDDMLGRMAAWDKFQTENNLLMALNLSIQLARRITAAYPADATQAARQYAEGVYANKVLKAAGRPTVRLSLRWLRERNAMASRQVA